MRTSRHLSSLTSTRKFRIQATLKLKPAGCENINSATLSAFPDKSDASLSGMTSGPDFVFFSHTKRLRLSEQKKNYRTYVITTITKKSLQMDIHQ
jgi:hypothetical protein